MIRQYPNNILLEQVRELLQEGHTVTMRVKGYSMRPFLNNEDKVLLIPIYRKIKRKDVVLAKVGEETYVLHRVIRIKGDKVILMGDGNLQGTEKCRIEEVIGIADSFIYDDSVLSCKSFRWKMYSQIWLLLLPFRGILLRYYKKYKE